MIVAVRLFAFVLVQGDDDCVMEILWEFSCSQQQTKNLWSLILSAGLPFSQISGGMPSIPAPSPLFNYSMAFNVSCSVGDLSNSVFTGC